MIVRLGLPLLLTVIAVVALWAAMSPGRAIATEAPPALHVCYALDDSASMWVTTDLGAPSDPGPNPLRYEAAKGAVALLGTDVNDSRDAVSFVIFGSATKPGNDIVTIPLTRITSNEVREQLSRKLDESSWSKGYTRIDEALEACRQVLEAGAEANSKPPYHEDGTAVAIVLLTDGVPASDNPAYDGEPQMKLISENILPLFKERGWPIYVVALGHAIKGPNDPYREWMDEVAETTGGQVTLAESRSDLLRIYTNLAADLTGRVYDSEPLSVSGAREITFDVEEDVERLNVTVVKSDPELTVELFDPAGDAVVAGHDGVVLTRTRLFENYTVPGPAAGQWRVSITGEGDVYFSAIKRLRPSTPTPTPVPPAPSPTPILPPSPSPAPSPSPSPTPAPILPAPLGSGDGGGFPVITALLLSLLPPSVVLGAVVWWRLRPRPFGYLTSDAGETVSLRRLAGRGLRWIWPRSIRLSAVLGELGLAAAATATRLEFCGDQMRVTARPTADRQVHVYVDDAFVKPGRTLPVEDGERIRVVGEDEHTSVEFHMRRVPEPQRIPPVQLEISDDPPEPGDAPEPGEDPPLQQEPVPTDHEAPDEGRPAVADLPRVEVEFVD